MNLLRRFRHAFKSPAPTPPVTLNLQEWCSTHPEATYDILSPERTIPLAPVHTMEPEIVPTFTHPSGRLRTKYLARLPHVRIMRENGLILLSDSSLAAEVFPTLQYMEEDANAAMYSQHATFKPGNYFSLVTYWWNYYYHWIHDSLQSLYLVLERLPADTKFIVPAKLSSKLHESLTLCGLSEERLEWFGDDDLWELENLFFSPSEGAGGNDSPEADAWFQTQIRNSLGLASPEPTRRIYIARSLARYRRIVNLPELEPILHKHGFEIVLPEEMSFRAQVELFSQAAIVAGPHGSGFTNMLFAPPECKVFELFERGTPNYTYRTMSSVLGHPYWYMQGDPIPNKGQDIPDVRVDPGLFEKTLDAMLEYKAAPDARWH